MTHCFGSFASLSSASSARATKPCSANSPNIEVVTIRVLLIRFLPVVNEGFPQKRPTFQFSSLYSYPVRKQETCPREKCVCAKAKHRELFSQPVTFSGRAPSCSAGRPSCPPIG